MVSDISVKVETIRAFWIFPPLSLPPAILTLAVRARVLTVPDLLRRVRKAHRSQRQMRHRIAKVRQAPYAQRREERAAVGLGKGWIADAWGAECVDG